MADSPDTPSAEVLIQTVTDTSGVALPAMTVQSGQLQCTVLLSPAQARLFADTIPDQLRKAAGIADDHNRPRPTLITPDTSTVNKIQRGRNNA